MPILSGEENFEGFGPIKLTDEESDDWLAQTTGRHEWDSMAYIYRCIRAAAGDRHTRITIGIEVTDPKWPRDPEGHHPVYSGVFSFLDPTPHDAEFHDLVKQFRANFEEDLERFAPPVASNVETADAH